MKKENVIKETYMKDIYLNVLKAIIIVFYFFVLNVLYQNVEREYLLIGIKVFTMIFLFISIYIFEKAYKKDSDRLALQGIEILVLSIYTLTTEHITNKYNFNFKSYSLVASYIFAIYYILRCILIYTKGRKELENDFSDVREIVKKEEPVQKEATKKSDKEKIKIKNDVEKEVGDVVEKEKKPKKETSKINNQVPKKRKKVVKDEEKNNIETFPKQKKKTSSTKKIIEENETKTKKINNDNIEKKEVNKKKTNSTAVKKKTSTNTTKKVVKEDSENTDEKLKRKRVKKEVKEND